MFLKLPYLILYMKRYTLKDLALVAEYNFTLGGAQRMLAIISKKMKKSIYLPFSSGKPSPVWDVKSMMGIPKEPIWFSGVVDRYRFRKFPGKKHIKFCHSGTSLENFEKNKNDKDVIWLTHRKRAREYWRKKGFNIELVPKGYIPYYKTELDINPNKANSAIFISRIWEGKMPDIAAKICEKAKIPLKIAGSWEFKDYANKICKMYQSETIKFVKPDNGRGISEGLKEKLLWDSKILLHLSKGGLHDYLEYSILDGLTYGCIPLCITKDSKQFSIIEKKKIGRVVSNEIEAIKAIRDLLENYNFYLENSKRFMKNFFESQNTLWRRWEKTFSKILKKYS